MPRYTIEFEGEFDNTLKKIAKKKGIGADAVLRRALASYFYINSVLEGAIIEREPGWPWKLSFTEDDKNGTRRIVKDVFLP